MAQLAIQLITAAGLEAAYAAAAEAGDTFHPNGGERTFLHVKNGAGATRTVTVAAVADTVRAPGVGVIAVPDMVVAITAGEERMIGPFPSAYVSSAGLVSVTYDDEASVTVAAIELPAP
jgi:L-2-hydroxyglutarate oxidase LhgO